MRSSIITAGVLLGIAAAFALQLGAQLPGTNVVPKDAMRDAIRRAMTSPSPRPVTATATRFDIKPDSKVCAIPLLQAHGTATHDPIAHLGPAPDIDPKMAVAPPATACSQASVPYTQPKFAPVNPVRQLDMLYPPLRAVPPVH
jgi:hypothetical protein